MTKDEAVDLIIALTRDRPQGDSQNWNEVRRRAGRFVAWLTPSDYSIDVDDDGLTFSGPFWSISVARGTRKHGGCKLTLSTRLSYDEIIDILKVVGIMRRPDRGARFEARKQRIEEAR